MEGGFFYSVFLMPVLLPDTSSLLFPGWMTGAPAIAGACPEMRRYLMPHFCAYAGYARFRRAFIARFPRGLAVRRVVAASTGGQVALRLMSEGLLRAERLILAGVPFSLKRDERAFTEAEAFAGLFARSRQKALRRFNTLCLLGGAEKTMPAAHPAYLAGRDKGAVSGVWLRELRMFDAAAYRVSVRSLTVFHGENDAVIPVSQAALWRSVYPRAEVKILPGAGHLFTVSAL